MANRFPRHKDFWRNIAIALIDLAARGFDGNGLFSTFTSSACALVDADKFFQHIGGQVIDSFPANDETGKQAGWPTFAGFAKVGTHAACVPIFHRDRRPHRSYLYKKRKG
jgi:hypothetical protein